MAGFAEIYVEFKPTSEGGRNSPVWLNEDAAIHYRPHLCVHGGNGEYLGVEFIDGPDRMIAPGEGTYATVRLMYEPQVSYDALSVGATFDIREGGKTVGTGRVTRR
jgi:translation elongation factor EF-Tu-like GTPase